MRQKLVVFSGAGISAESGLATFRDNDGLWENHDVHEVATIEAWHANPALVQRFYNERRRQVREASPNAAHDAIARLEEVFDVAVVTQNIDDLHERAGSSDVLHIHGQIVRSRSSVDPSLTYPIDGWELSMGELCEKGSQLRPDVVWFGESVPLMSEASQIVASADVFIVVGSSLQVYPAADLIYHVRPGVPKFFVDPAGPGTMESRGFEHIREKAAVGVPMLVERLLA